MWSRKEAIASAPPTRTWPRPLTNGLDNDRKEKYEAQVLAIELYFANEQVAEISRLTGVSSTRLPELARKCLLPSSDGAIFGFRGLLPYNRIKEYERTAIEKYKFPEGRGGQAGALQALVRRLTEVEETLVKYIRKEAKEKHVDEFKLRPKDLHRIFIKLIKEKGVPSTEWPFTTKFLGKRSIEKYMRNVIDQSFGRSVNTRAGQEARAHLNVGTGHDPFLVFSEPYDAVEIDAYKIECHLAAAFKTPEGTESIVLLERLWLIAVVDRASSAVLSYTVVYRSEVNSDDIVRVIRQAIAERWTPKEITIPGLTYPAEGGLPNGVIEAAYGAIWTTMMFDGALAHLASAVHDRVRKTLGCVINWGAVGHFERRPNVERTFNQVAADLFKRLPSTTGSSPERGRAEDSEKKAVRHRIIADEAEQLLDVVMAQHNATPSEGKSFLAPLEVLRYFLEGPRANFLVRRLPKTLLAQAKTFASHEVATVRGSVKEGRRPYIQLDRVHYTNPVLANSAHLIGQLVTAEINEDDYRQVVAFLSNGAELGVLKAQGKWGLTPHSRRTRRAINSLISKRVITVCAFDDPVQVYMSYLGRTQGAKKDKPPAPRQATKAAGIAKEAGLPPRLSRPNPPARVPEQDAKPRPPCLLLPENDFFTKVRNRR